MRKKYYVVWKGRKPGIYRSWKECEKQVKGYPGSKYKGFDSEEEAKRGFDNGWKKYIGKGRGRKKNTYGQKPKKRFFSPSISVDASCLGNPGTMEYRGVDTHTHKEVFRSDRFPLGTNNIGEFLAIVKALNILKKKGKDIPIYSDSTIALGWVRKKVCNTSLSRTRKTEKLFQEIDKALRWLRNNEYDNPLLKWDTKRWGEIPADFGRK